MTDKNEGDRRGGTVCADDRSGCGREEAVMAETVADYTDAERTPPTNPAGRE